MIDKFLSDYKPKELEREIFEYWVNKKLFDLSINKKNDKFSVILPPPNITGILHVGHTWDSFIQDSIVRYKRMKGYDVLFVPAMDHAGIATEVKVEEYLRSKNLSKRDIGKDKFIEYVWQWKEKYSSIIRQQWKAMGLSLNYAYEGFTMDKEIQEIVTKVFINLYNKGLIYRAEKVINYDTKLKTAISNIEVVTKEVEAYEYYIKYKIMETNEDIVIMTTRPETIFGDVAIAVNPHDKRYTNKIGKHVCIPVANRVIPIISDEYVDIKKGTGCVKITPNHDVNDFEMAKRHNMSGIDIINIDGTLKKNKYVPEKYSNLNRFEARKALVMELEKENYLADTIKVIHPINYSERTDTPIETLCSKQWFICTRDLAKEALLNNNNNSFEISFYPERFKKIFIHWSENLHDWCISRNIYWGHKIPAWIHKKTEEIYVGIKPPKNEQEWVQEESVLDTWFSSTLWPLLALGWPNKNDVLYKNFFPLDILVSGYDIIYFWVSRMIYQSYANVGTKPFSNVLIHGLVRDENGRKMSKSLNNGINPMHIIDKHGSDSLRYFLLTSTTPGHDINFNEKKVEDTTFFINKIWNATKFAQYHINEVNLEYNKEININVDRLDIYDKWIINKLCHNLEIVQQSFDKYEFGEIARCLYTFIWDLFCNWYLEINKFYFVNKLRYKDKVIIFKKLLETIIKLLYPLIPHVCQRLWLALGNETLLDNEKYPTVSYFKSLNINDQDNNFVDLFINILTDIRRLRSDYNLPTRKISIYLEFKDYKILHRFKEEEALFKYFGKIKVVNFNKNIDIIINKKQYVYNGLVMYIDFNEIYTIEEQLENFSKEKKYVISEINRAEKLLNNDNFIKKAPVTLVKKEEIKLNRYREKLKIIESQVSKIIEGG